MTVYICQFILLRELRSLPLLFCSSPGQRLVAHPGICDNRSVFSLHPLNCSFSLSGFMLAAATDKTVCLWEVSTGKEIGQLIGHQKACSSLAFSPDGKTLASGSSDKSIRIWEVATCKEVRQLGHETGVIRLAWSPDGGTLASACESGLIYLWEAANGRQRRSLSGHQHWIGQLAWSHDGSVLASGGSDGTLRLWDPQTGKEHRIIGLDNGGPRQLEKGVIKGNPNAVGSLGWIHGLVFSLDDKAMFTASQDYKSVFVWDVATGKQLRRLTGAQRIFSLCLSPDGKTLAAGGAGGMIDLWDLTTNRPVHQFGGHHGRAFTAVFSPDGKVVASGGDDQVIRRWEVGTWRERGQLAGHEGCIHRLAFSGDGKMLASCGFDQTVRVWDLRTGREARAFADGQMLPRSVALSPDGTKVVAVSANGMVVMWDSATGNELLRLDPAEGGTAITFSPDGQTLAVGSVGTIVLRHVVTGKIFRRFRGEPGRVESLAYAVDGKSLLSGGEDLKLHLWEVATGEERLTCEGHLVPIHSVAISPDGKVLASCSGSYYDHRDDKVHLWDAATGKELRRFRGHQNVVLSVSFSPEGKILASASEDTTVLIWHTTSLVSPAPQRSDGLSAERLERLWAALAEEGASEAYQAVLMLTASPDQGLRLLRKHLRPVAPPNKERLARLLADLDSDRFAVRQEATKELEKLGEPAEPALRRALAAKPSLEGRQRLERLVTRVRERVLSSTDLRNLRAVEVLEHIATPEAKKVLQTLATGTPEARLTQEAKASLDRLVKRPGSTP